MAVKENTRLCPTCGLTYIPCHAKQVFCSKKCRRGCSGIKARPVIDRLMDHIEFEPFSGCWLWTAQLNHNGYGIISTDQMPEAAHRVSYRLFRGPIPEGLQIDHLCRVRCCVNPQHLEVVTLQENLRRGFGNGPAHEAFRKLCAKITHCKHGHEYTEENTRIYNGKRNCAQCRLQNSRNHRKRLRERHC